MTCATHEEHTWCHLATMKLGRAPAVILALAVYAASNVRAFVLSPAAPATRPTHRKVDNHVSNPISYTRTNTINSRRARVCLSSPFENPDYDDEDAVQREAEQLEEMIRGRRGVVVEVIERQWREEMIGTLKAEGERLCAEAYEGFETRGRGALFVNVDMGLSGNSKGHDGAVCHAVFRSLEEVVTERSSRVKPSDQMQIIQRCQEYNPEEGFVIVFGHKGMLGVQVVRPSQAPRKVHRARRAP